MPELTKPTIHLNGTSAADLREGYVQAHRAVELAREALCRCNPNGRDYYVVPGSLDAAIAEQIARQLRLASVAAELLELAVHCDKFTRS
jgi:hypothetical protein